LADALGEIDGVLGINSEDVRACPVDNPRRQNWNMWVDVEDLDVAALVRTKHLEEVVAHIKVHAD